MMKYVVFVLIRVCFAIGIEIEFMTYSVGYRIDERIHEVVARRTIDRAFSLIADSRSRIDLMKNKMHTFF